MALLFVVGVAAMARAAASPVTSGVQVDVFPNAARAGAPSASFRAANLSGLAFPAASGSVFSVSILGSLRPPHELAAASGEVWDVRCRATAGLSVFLHLDDHLVCQSGHDNKTWVDFKAQAQIPFEGARFAAKTNAAYTLRATLLHRGPTSGTPSFTVAYRRVKRSNLPPLEPPTPVGCFGASKQHLRLNATTADGATTNGPDLCSAVCAAYAFFGLSSGHECWCGDSYGADNRSSGCSIPCPGNGTSTCGGPGSRSVYAQHSTDDSIALRPLPSSAFAGAARPAQLRWLNESRRLTEGRWGTWSRNSMTTHVLLPMGLLVKIGLCRISTRTCKLDVPIDGLGESLRLGPIANDFAYTQLSFTHAGANVSVETSQLGPGAYADWAVRVRKASAFNTSDFVVVAAALMADEGVPDASWHLPGSITTADSSGVGAIHAVAAGTGMPRVTLTGGQPRARLDDFSPTSLPYLAWPLDANGSVAFGTGSSARSSQQLNALLDQAAAAELATYSAVGKHAEAKMVSQLAGMWMLQHFPANPGLFAVTGGWSRIYTIFCWDSVFAAYQLSIDGGAGKDLAYSTLATVLHTKTAQGLIPNFWQSSENGVSYDRTEEPLGAKVLLEMFQRYNDTWVVELLYPDLYDLLEWFWRKRRVGIGLVVLGSDVGLPSAPMPAGTIIVGSWDAGRDEAADNSPMYDGFGPGKANGGEPGANGSAVFNASTHRMNLFDVGMTSLVCMELQALATLALTAFNPPRQADHDHLMAHFAELSQLLTDSEAGLWDKQTGMFVNRHLDGTFFRRLAPTSFYPMLSGLATEQQAVAMVRTLQSPDGFCVSGKRPLRPECQWPMPSIAASDPAFKTLGYWRGYVWGPQIQLTYWALDNPRYANVTEVRAARRAMVAQAAALEREVWRTSGHLCENYCPGNSSQSGPIAPGQAACCGGNMYHWGALTGFVSLLEAGLYDDDSGSILGLKSDDEPTARDYWPTKSWRSASPESQGFDASKLAAAAELVHHFNLGGRKLNASHWEMTSGADAFIVTRGGYVVAEHYWRNTTNATLHDSESCAKSIASALIAHAVHAGHLSLKTPVSDFYEIHNLSAAAASAPLLVENLIAMSGGLNATGWQGGNKYTDPICREWNEAFRQGTGPLAVGDGCGSFVAKHGQLLKPGLDFVYSFANTGLMSGIINKTTGLSYAAYAAQPSGVFEKIGIVNESWRWLGDAQGLSEGDGSFYTTLGNFARYSLLMLSKGNWDGEQLLDPEYVKAVGQPTPGGVGGCPNYSHFLWKKELKGVPRDAFYAYGGYGQFAIMIPSLDITINTFFGAYLGTWSPPPDIASYQSCRGCAKQFFPRQGQVIANAAPSGIHGGDALCKGGYGWNWTAVPNGNPKTYTTAPPRPAVPGGVMCGGGGSADGDLLTTMVAAVVAAVVKTDDEPISRAQPLPRLVFEVGEGFRNSLVVSTRGQTNAGNFTVLDAQLQNIHDALLSLTKFYQVDVLLYPTHLYNLTAKGATTAPLQRFHPGLMHFMSFFEKRGKIGVFLEAYSSGIVTQQVGPRQANCEPHCMPPTSLNGAPLSKSNPGYIGLSMDLQAVSAMKAVYPRALVGVRFHEVLGCDSVWRSDGQKDCFQMSPEIFTGFIDLCAETGMTFFHNDNSWLLAHDLGTKGHGQWSYHADRPAYYAAKLLEENTTSTADYARAKLGKNALLSFENNGWGPPAALAFYNSVINSTNTSVAVASWMAWDWTKMPGRVKQFPLIAGNNSWGLSNQPWAWSEWQHSMVGPYYQQGMMFTPIEFLQQYCLWAIDRRADVIQFEPSNFLFDEYFLNQDASVALERPLQPGQLLPSHKERIALRRLKAVLLAKASGKEDQPPMPSADLGTVFDRDQQLFMSNRAARPPKNYKQSQLLVASQSGNALDTVDAYSDGRHYQMQPLDVPTFPAHVTANATALLGAEITGDFVSELARITVNSSHATINWFFSWGGAVDAPLAFPLLDATSGCELIEEGGLAIGNYVPLQVQGGQGDPDEIVVSRACKNNSVVFELWTMAAFSWRTLDIHMIWTRAAPALEIAVLGRLLGKAYQHGVYKASSDNSLVAVLGRHAERSAEIQGHQPSNATRTLDDLFTVVHLAAHGLLQVSVPALQAEAVELIAASDYAVVIGRASSFKLIGAAAMDVNPRAGNTGDELLLLHTQSNDSATIFTVNAASKKITQSASSQLARPLRCLSGGKHGGCVLAARRALIPTLGDVNPPSPPRPPPDPCGAKCVAPCGTTGKGASGGWLASILNVIDPCECCKNCCANIACKAWQLCTGSTCAKDLHTCWLKSTPAMVANAASTSGLRLKMDDAHLLQQIGLGDRQRPPTNGAAAPPPPLGHPPPPPLRGNTTPD